MPKEPHMVREVRQALDETKQMLEKMIPQTELFDFLCSRVLPELGKQVGKYTTDVLRVISSILHSQQEVSYRIV